MTNNKNRNFMLLYLIVYYSYEILYFLFEKIS